jgi:hypothetical protein
VVIGDEYYAASAYLTREPTVTGSIVGQDIAKALLMAIVLAGIGLATYFGGQHMDHSWLFRNLGTGP